LRYLGDGTVRLDNCFFKKNGAPRGKIIITEDGPDIGEHEDPMSKGLDIYIYIYMYE
jgi:hypothetical protein